MGSEYECRVLYYETLLAGKFTARSAIHLGYHKACNSFLCEVEKVNGESEMRTKSKKYRLNSYEGEKLPFGNYMKLDNTDLPPDEAARMIKAHFLIG